MITILVTLFFGWLLSLVGLDTLFHNLVGFEKHQYYALFLVMGLMIWVKRLFDSE